MRVLTLTAFALLAGCGSKTSSTVTDGNSTAFDQQAVAPAPSPTTARGMRGDEPATSASAREARNVVQRYFALLARHKYDDARKFWGNDGNDTRGTPAQFAASFARYSVYSAKVNAPTEIKASSGMQYILVAADLHVKVKRGGAEADRSGAVMLRRSADPSEASADKREWRIWGVDIRKQH